MKKVIAFVCIVMLLILLPVNALAADKIYYPPYLYSVSHWITVNTVNSPHLKVLNDSDIEPVSQRQANGGFSENATITIHPVDGQVLPEYITVEQMQADRQTWVPINSIYDKNTGKITCNNISYISYHYSRSADLRITADACAISFYDGYNSALGIVAAPGADITLPQLSDRQWFRFGGWCTADNKPFAATTMPAGGAKLQAKWIYDEKLGATPPTADTALWPFILVCGAGFMAMVIALPKKKIKSN